jgi:polysaccharide biosynthesis protein VpsM
MANKKLAIPIAFALFSTSGAATAQQAYVRPAYQFPVAPIGSGPASVPIAGSPLYIAPYLGFAAGHDDNIFLSNRNEKSSMLYVTSPGFKIDARSPGQVFQLSYQGQVGRYADSEDDNYVDHTTRALYDVAFDRRNFLQLGFDHVRGHDPRGSTDRPLASRPDRYRLSSPYATYAFGAPGAQGRAELYYSAGYKRYLNNRATTFASDRQMEEFGGAFYMRVMPKTYALVEARNTALRYREPGSPFSADERRIYAGVSWEATAATTGTLKVGHLRRRFDSDLQPTFSGASWEATVAWAPRTYSKFDFYAARQTNESTGLGSFILSSIYGVNWTHAWSSVLSTGLDLRFQKDEYQNFNRSDDVKSLGFKVGYKFRRWLTLGAEYTHTQRDSNQPLFEYDRNLYLLTATATM